MDFSQYPSFAVAAGASNKIDWNAAATGPPLAFRQTINWNAVFNQVAKINTPADGTKRILTGFGAQLDIRTAFASDQIKGVYIDNSLNFSDVVLFCVDTGFQVPFKAGESGFSPILTDNQQFVVYCVGQQVNLPQSTELYFLNTSIPVGQRQFVGQKTQKYVSKRFDTDLSVTKTVPNFSTSDVTPQQFFKAEVNFIRLGVWFQPPDGAASGISFIMISYLSFSSTPTDTDSYFSSRFFTFTLGTAKAEEGITLQNGDLKIPEAAKVYCHLYCNPAYGTGASRTKMLGIATATVDFYYSDYLPLKLPAAT